LEIFHQTLSAVREDRTPPPRSRIRVDVLSIGDLDLATALLKGKNSDCRMAKHADIGESWLSSHMCSIDGMSPTTDASMLVWYPFAGKVTAQPVKKSTGPLFVLGDMAAGEIWPVGKTRYSAVRFAGQGIASCLTVTYAYWTTVGSAAVFFCCLGGIFAPFARRIDLYYLLPLEFCLLFSLPLSIARSCPSGLAQTPSTLPPPRPLEGIPAAIQVPKPTIMDWLYWKEG
jgi:hypothetical protein